MAQVKVTAELLRGFAQTLRTESERFDSIKKQMDEQLIGFMWDDPVAHKFKADYEERLQSLKTKLLPAMEKYQQHLDEEANVIDSYTENGSPSLSALKAAAVGAGVVGVGATGILMNEVSTKRKEWLNHTLTGTNSSIPYISEEQAERSRLIEEIKKIENPDADSQETEKYINCFEKNGVWQQGANKDEKRVSEILKKCHNLDKLDVQLSDLRTEGIEGDYLNGVIRIDNGENKPTFSIGAHEATHAELEKLNTIEKDIVQRIETHKKITGKDSEKLFKKLQENRERIRTVGSENYRLQGIARQDFMNNSGNLQAMQTNTLKEYKTYLEASNEHKARIRGVSANDAIKIIEKHTEEIKKKLRKPRRLKIND